MKICAIITSYIEGELKPILESIEYDYLICADGGLQYALDCGIKPNLAVGDFDSYTYEMPEGVGVIRLPKEKDDTDTAYCVKYAAAQGAEKVYIIGGLGGRADHTVANIQLLNLSFRRSIDMYIFDGRNMLTLVTAVNQKKTVQIKKQGNCKISLFSFTPACRHVTTKNLKYPLNDATLDFETPIGVSNEFTADEAEVSFTYGKLLIILSKD